jgi:hypothetical protein
MNTVINFRTSLTGREFSEHLGDCSFLKKDSTPFSTGSYQMTLQLRTNGKREKCVFMCKSERCIILGAR